jgi:ribosomal protein S18 acetylase RimI-like enzyme
MPRITQRPYDPKDQAACLAIFDANTPRCFATTERSDFADHLETCGDPDTPYMVLIENGVLIACGGLSRPPGSPIATLSWGMVHPARHGQGLGQRLLDTRLALARSLPGLHSLSLSTSHHSSGFYRRAGFIVTGITKDGFAPGLDRWDMTLTLT